MIYLLSKSSLPSFMQNFIRLTLKLDLLDEIEPKV